MKQHLMSVHSISGCDTVSAPYMNGKKIALEVLRSYGDQDSLSTFTEPRSPPEYITNVEVRFLPTLYGAGRSTSLDKLRYILYTRAVSRSSPCHLVSNLIHCRQLPQQPSSIHTVPILQCNNYWPCQDNDEEIWLH